MSDLFVPRFTIPLPGKRQVVVEGDFPLTEAEWGLFVGVLDAMKPGLIQEPVPKEQDPEASS